MGDPQAMVDRTMSSTDKDNDGKLSAEEIGGMPEGFRDRIKAADTNGDGNVERAELLAAMKKMAAARSRQGGGQVAPAVQAAPVEDQEPVVAVDLVDLGADAVEKAAWL